ncbi:MAG TPA: hypothetical protein VJP88_10625 [Caulobacteraceae bacterium]|nr:hypothetical protein [Caulobacteraceae bacterium]
MTLKTFLAAAGAAALAMSVSGCNQNASSQSVTARDCTPFPKADVVSNDPSTAFEDCVHRWSYALARARDPADVVAQAAVDACNDDLTKWNEQALNQSPAGSAETAPSLTNGSPTDAMGSHAQYAQSRD